MASRLFNMENKMGRHCVTTVGDILLNWKLIIAFEDSFIDTKTDFFYKKLDFEVLNLYFDTYGYATKD